MPSFMCIQILSTTFTHSLHPLLLRNVLSGVRGIFHAHQLVLRDLLLETVQQLFHSARVQLANLQVITQMNGVSFGSRLYVSIPRVLVRLCSADIYTRDCNCCSRLSDACCLGSYNLRFIFWRTYVRLIGCVWCIFRGMA